MKNPYEILGVGKTATDAEIKAAYRKMVLKYHPDKNAGDKAAEEKFKEASNAYDILKDPQKKAAYDRFGDAAFGAGNGASAGAGGFGGFNGNPFGGGGGFEFNFNGFDMSEMMDEVLRGFGFNTGRRRRPEDQPGRDMLHRVSITLEEAYSGKTETVKIPGEKREVEVKIPAGILDGARLRLAGAGEKGPYGGPSGDLYIDVHIRPHSVFARDGKNLFMKPKIPFAMLALGGEIEVSTIDDKKISVKVPAGTEVGEMLRVKGKGMPGGDLYIEASVEIPRRLSRAQRKILEEFQKAE